jgi:hypothetical protein
MKYYIDTEFIEGFHEPLFGKRRHFIELISIGIVSEDGRSYYAISSEYNYNKASDWVKENVILNIYRQLSPIKKQFMDVHNFHKHCGSKNSDIAMSLVEFIHAPIIEKYDDGFLFSDEIIENAFKYNNEPVHEFYGYYSDYDWVLFCSLFGTMMDLPRGFPMYCKDLKQMLDDKAMNLSSIEASKIAHPDCVHNVFSYLDKTTNGKYKINALKKHPEYPKQANEHNALDDAMWNKNLHQFIINL